MSFERITDHEERAISRLPDIYRRPRFEAWLRAYATEIQELEDAFYSLSLVLAIDRGEGIQLDRIGAIVGRAREGRSDRTYRLWLKAEVRSNQSEGRGNDLLDVLGLLLPNSVQLQEHYPMLTMLTVDDAVDDDTAALAGILKRTRMGGTRVQLHTTPVDDVDTFTFADGDAPEASATQGFADDARAVGGTLSDVEVA